MAGAEPAGATAGDEWPQRAKGKRRRALNVPVMEVPTKAEWKEHLAGEGKEGGWFEGGEVLGVRGAVGFHT
mgnify:CR=1 FL=1